MTAEELNPEEILKLSESYWETSTLHAGVKLNVFTMTCSPMPVSGKSGAFFSNLPMILE
jgi:hypothetical protein